jgi:hypothetical protein
MPAMRWFAGSAVHAALIETVRGCRWHRDRQRRLTVGWCAVIGGLVLVVDAALAPAQARLTYGLIYFTTR